MTKAEIRAEQIRFECTNRLIVHPRAGIKDYEDSCRIGAEWADAHPKNPYHKYPDEEPPSFGDYIVVINSKNNGRRWAFKCWYGHPNDPFGDNPSKEWVLDEDEVVKYWMSIPELPIE